MGPIQADPLVHARSIVRNCMARDACAELAPAKGTQRVAELQAFGRNDDGAPAQGTRITSRSSRAQRIGAPAQLTRVRAAALFMLSCMLIVALVASRALAVHH